MLKKLVSCFMVFTLIVIATSVALPEDSFILRNDIQFGDSMAQVRVKETQPFNEEECDENTLWTKGGTVAGINNVQVVYFFDSTGKLTDVRWDCPQDSSDYADGQYETLYTAFVKKYGAPLGYRNGECYIITGKAFESTTVTQYFANMLSMYFSLRDYAEWDYEYASGKHVKIELLEIGFGETILNAEYGIIVSYKYFTDADLKDAQNEKQQENQAIMDDI